MTIQLLTAWLLSTMLVTVPPGRSKYPIEARESAAEGKTRYGAIAGAIAKVTMDPSEAPLYSGKHARAKTAALLLAISLFESHWRRHIDLGLGARAKRSRYHCMMQIAVDRGKTPEGWTGADLVKYRERCFRRALHILQRGRRFCGKHGLGFLSHYAAGNCKGGRKAIAKRVRKLEGWLRTRPFVSPRGAARR